MRSAAPPAPSFMRRRRGFTLTEMAVVLAILALLIGGMILPLSAQQDLRLTAETRKLLADVGDALYGFAASHSANDGKPYLPCPDTDGDGAENRSATPGPCTSQEGALPWATLGLGRQDAWGNALRYRVTAAFSNSSTGFTLLTAGDLRVCESSACTVVLGSALPVIVLSPGKNGAGVPSHVDEPENLDADADFVQQTGSTTGFDDLLVWLPPSLLTQRMVAAGRLP